MSHGRESEWQAKRIARFKSQGFHAGSRKDHCQTNSQRLDRYRETLQRAFTN